MPGFCPLQHCTMWEKAIYRPTVKDWGGPSRPAGCAYPAIQQRKVEKYMHYKGRSSLGLLALGIATATQVWAQDAVQIETGTAVRTLDEIVVTARRRDESSQAVPV